MKRICVTVLLAVLTVGCSGQEVSPTPGSASDLDTVAAGQQAPAADDDTDSSPAEAQTPGAVTESPAAAASGESADDDPAPTDADDAEQSATAPAPEQDSAPQEDEEEPASRETSGELPFEVTLSATCLRHGDEVTIEIRTDPVVGVAYHAVYAGEEGGAPPPYGGGHGGNGGDMTDEQGRYSDSWVVGPNAPEGPGRIDIVVGARDQHWQFEEPIEVASRLTGTCENGS